jgi:hypothetical protein
MDEIDQRARRAAERILEDERLTDNLEDEAAQVLIDWGIARAEAIARTTEDAPTMQNRLQAVRRLMRYVNRWIPRRVEADNETNREILTKILELAAVAYGQTTPLISPGLVDAVAAQLATSGNTPSEVIRNLLTLVENRLCDHPDNSEERYGTEIYF